MWPSWSASPTSTSHLAWFFSIENSSITFKGLWTYLRHVSVHIIIYDIFPWNMIYFSTYSTLTISGNFSFVLPLNTFSILHIGLLTLKTQIIFALLYYLLSTYFNILFIYIHCGYLKPSFFLSYLSSKSIVVKFSGFFFLFLV